MNDNEINLDVNTYFLRHFTPLSLTRNFAFFAVLLSHLPFFKKKACFRAIIFDKDGTIICFNSLWVPWAKIVAHKISQDITKDIESEILMALGFCVETQRIFPGVLAEGTEKQISSVLVNLLVNHGICRNIAQSVVDKHIKISSISSQHVVQLYDLKNMFTTLRQHSIMTAIVLPTVAKGHYMHW
ncbi:unnamed protein product [Heterobilharzia americana]|nr:unnamed protein product [Heterobilharzia americana]